MLRKEGDVLFVEARSPINIALVKYWGKVDENRIIPTNNSLSITVRKEDLCSKTRVLLVKEEGIKLVLNGKEEKVGARIINVVAAIRQIAAKKTEVSVSDEETKESKVAVADLLSRGIVIESENNFRTAAGLASSSSGLSCLAVCLAAAYGLEEEFSGQFSTFARMGSGSACRSVFGGFVEWQRGYEHLSELASDLEGVSQKSVAKKWFADEPEVLEWWCQNLSILICVVKPDEGQGTVKEIPSTEGMQQSVKTSELLQLKLDANLPARHIEILRKALIQRDFGAFCEVVIKESNQLHAVCLDTTPAIFYMNQTSKAIVHAINGLNSKETTACYSCDAGFHVFVFTLSHNLEKVRTTIANDPRIHLEQMIVTGIDKTGVEIIH